MRNKYPRQRPQPHVNSYVEQDAEQGLDQEDDDSRSPWRMRFGMRGLLMLMLISSILFAGGGYLLHAVRGGGRGFQLAFILFTLVGPMALLMVFTIVAWVMQIRQWYPEPSGDEEDESGKPF